MFKSAAVIGYGRFGEVWAKLLTSRFDVAIVESNPSRAKTAQDAGYVVEDASTALSRDAIFYCVPIAAFREVVTAHKQLLLDKKPKAVFDCLSVKVHPKKVFEELSLIQLEVGLLHPLFGPDSVKVHGVSGLPIAIDRETLSDESYEFWKEFFVSTGLVVHAMSAEEHDRIAANSQGLTHYIGRILGEMKVEKNPIDTVGASKLHEIKDQVCNDTLELFYDLQQYNPYTLSMRLALGEAQSRIYGKLLPNRINCDKLVVGIQGGPGSFNEEAAHRQMQTIGENNYQLEYLYTSDAVLRALYEGKTDRGIFAIHNAQGGIVDESVQAIARHTFSILDEFAIIISHCLLIHPEADKKMIDTIMGHSQAIKQCRTNLGEKFPTLKLRADEGALADPSKISEELVAGNIPKTTAVLGSSSLAGVFGLRVVASNLQDLAENYTSFLFVQRG